MNNLKKCIVILVVVSIVMAFVLIINFNKGSKSNENNASEVEIVQNKQVSKVNNATMYFTVQSCINSYISYLTQKDTESIYKLLDKSYIEKFNITEKNVLEFVEDFSGELTFKAKEMQFEEISDDLYKYYAKGEIIENDIDGRINKGQAVITVNMDTNNMLFSVIPYGYGGVFYEEK